MQLSRFTIRTSDDIEGERWTDLKSFGYSGYYVSNIGRIYSVKTNKVLKHHIQDSGYHQVELISGKKIGVHRLVAIAFISNPNKLPLVNHKDGNKSNNNDWNLEWCTNKDNQIHAERIGLTVKNKLSEEQKLWIIQHCIPKHPLYGVSKLAIKFNVSQAVISNVIKKGVPLKCN